MIEQINVDEVDERIMGELSADSRQSYRQLAKKLHLAPATVINRIKKLEKEKVILGYGCDLDYSKLGYEFAALVEVTIAKGALLEVQKKIAEMPGVVGVYDVTGETDSVVFARCKSRTEFSRLVKKILAIPNVQRSNTHIILNIIKEDYKSFV